MLLLISWQLISSLISGGMCTCGCYERILLGSHLAAEIRAALHKEIGITCCAGISYNKLLAKLVGEQHKPNQQTTLFPHSVPAFMAKLPKARNIPGMDRCILLHEYYIQVKYFSSFIFNSFDLVLQFSELPII